MKRVAGRGALVCLLAMLALGSAAACSSGDPELSTLQQALPETTKSLEIHLPPGTSTESFALAARESLALSDRVRVETPSGAYAKVSSVGLGAVNVGTDTKVGDVYGRGTVTLRNRAQAGFVRSTRPLVVQQGATFSGKDESFAFDPLKRTSFLVRFPAVTSTNINLEPDQKYPLPTAQDPNPRLEPGRYGSLLVKRAATLFLKAGVYYFTDVTIDADGIVALDQTEGSVQIFIEGSFTFRGVLSTTDGSLPDPLVVPFGTGNNPIERTFLGTIMAPNGTLTLASVSRPHTGWFYARHLLVNPDTVVRQRPTGIGSTTPSHPLDPPIEPPGSYVSPAAHCGNRGGLAISAWAMAGFCPTHLGLSPFSGARNGDLQWSIPTGDDVVAQAVVGPTRDVFFGSLDGKLRRVTKHGGDGWVFDAGAAVRSTPALARSGDIYFGADDGVLRSLDRDGQLRWSFSTVADGGPAYVRSSPLVDSAGQIYFGAGSGFAYALSPAGALVWKQTLGAATTSSPALGGDGDLVYIAAGANGVYALRVGDGSVAWQRSSLGSVSGSPTVNKDGSVLVGSANGTFYALNGSSGAISWQANVGGSLEGSASVGPDGAIHTGSTNGKLVSLLPTGAQRWAVTLGGAVRTTPAVGGDGIIYVGSDDGVVSALRPDTGGVIWSRAVGSAVQGSPAIASTGQIYVGANDGVLYALGDTPKITDDLIPGTYTGPFGTPSGPGGGLTQGSGGNGGGSGGSGGVIDNTPLPLMPAGTIPDDAKTPLPVGPGDDACTPGAGPYPQTVVTPASGTGLLFDQTPTNPRFIYDASASCELELCSPTEVPDSRTTTQILADLNRPSTAGSSCAAASGTTRCQADDTVPPGALCGSFTPGVPSESQCPAGTFCGIVCLTDDPTCPEFEERCLTPKATCSGLGPQPSSGGPFSQQDDTTWPCEDVRECADTLPDFEAIGSSLPEKPNNHVLEEKKLPSIAVPSALPIPDAYASYLSSDSCAANAKGKGSMKQAEPRRIEAGSSKWGIFIEPSINQTLDITPKALLGDADATIEASASLVAGANVWGIQLKAVEAIAKGKVTTCGVELDRSVKVFGREVLALFDLEGSTLAGVQQAKVACELANTRRATELRALKKALYDAKAAKDNFERNGATVAFCNRTRELFPSVGPTCNSSYVDAWMNSYQSKVASFTSTLNDAYGAARDLQWGNEVPLVVWDTPFSLLGAGFDFPIGPITVSVEIEVSGSYGVGGTLGYNVTGQGPVLSADATIKPHAAILAFAYAGAGIGPITVGFAGELTLLGIGVPLSSHLSLENTAIEDLRPVTSSGIVKGVNALAAFPTRAQKWTANWDFGAALELESLSGQIDLAARVKLLFFTKTFRKKIAEFSGFKKTYRFLGGPDSPLSGTQQLGSFPDELAYPTTLSLQTSPPDTTAPLQPMTTLGPPNAPGVCGNPPTTCGNAFQSCQNQPCCFGLSCDSDGNVCCSALGQACSESEDICCGGLECRSGRCQLVVVK